MNFLLMLVFLMSNPYEKCLTSNETFDESVTCFVGSISYTIESPETIDGTLWSRDFSLSVLGPSMGARFWTIPVPAGGSVTYINGTSQYSPTPHVRIVTCSGFSVGVRVTCPDGSTVDRSRGVLEHTPCS